MSRNGIEENVSVVYLISTWVLLGSNNGNQCAKFWLLIDRAAWNIPECEIKALASDFLFSISFCINSAS